MLASLTKIYTILAFKILQFRTVSSYIRVEAGIEILDNEASHTSARLPHNFQLCSLQRPFGVEYASIGRLLFRGV